MLKLNEKKLLEEESVQKIQFDGKWYFDTESLSAFLKEDLSDVKTIKLPLNDGYKNTATLEQIENGRKAEELSDFNKALLKMKNFKK